MSLSQYVHDLLQTALEGLTGVTGAAAPALAARFESSDDQTFTIGNGATGAAVAPVDLGAVYGLLQIECLDATNIAANTTLSLEVDRAAAANVKTVLSPDTGATWTPVVPGAGDFSIMIPFIHPARFVRCILSNAAGGGDVVLTVTGFDRVA